MARLSLDEKIARVEEQIAKEELSIETIKKRIKTLKDELNGYKAQKEMSFANGILKLMKSKGISNDDIVKMLNSNTNDDNSSSPNENK